MDGSLAGSGWYGKRFSGLDDADPLLFYTADRSGFFVADPIGVAMALARGVADLSTVRDEIEKPASAARLRPIEHRGSVSMAMVYDAIPAIDHFRKVDDCTVLGIMDRRNDPGTYFFVLKRDA